MLTKEDLEEIRVEAKKIVKKILVAEICAVARKRFREQLGENLGEKAKSNAGRKVKVDYATLAESVKEGNSIAETAEKHGVSPTTVARAVLKHS